MNRFGDSSASMRDASDGPPAWLAWLLLSLIVLASAVLVAPVLAADVTLSWIANTEADLAGYKIYQSTISGQYGAPVATVGKVTTQTLTLPTLTVDQTYFWTITAYDLAGNESGKSAEVSKLVAGVPAVTKPGTPVLTVAAKETELLVAWEPVSDGAGGTAKIDIRLGSPTDHWGLMVSQSCPSSPCRIAGLTGGTAYQVAAVAYRAETAGNAFGAISAPVLVTTLTPDLPPAQPQGLQVVSATAERVVIVASAKDCRRVTTSTVGSTASQQQRIVTCVTAGLK